MTDRPVSRSGRSLTYYTDAVTEPALQARLRAACCKEGYFTRMFQEDASHVLPYGLGHGEGFAVELSGDNSAEERSLVANALSPDERGYGLLERGLRDFVSRAAQLLVTCGPLTYEVDLLSYADAEPPEPPFAFDLRLIQPGTLDSIHGRPVQYVPQGRAVGMHDGLGFVELDAARLVRVELAKADAREARDVLRFLAEADAQQRAEFALVTQSMAEETPYRSTAHHDETGELMAAATASVGWTARGLYSKDRLDPYVAWRSLRFLAFKIRILDAAIEGINRGLAIAGPEMGFEVRLEVSDIPTLADVEEAKRELASGSRSLSDLIRIGL